MGDPRVSVVVTNYNHARFLAQRLESVLEQGFQDFELLYLDDASTDDSEAVFSRFRDDPRIRAFPNTRNSGNPYRQLNRGVAEASGEYVWVAESDDVAEASFLGTLVAVLDANPACGLAYCQSQVIDEHDRVVGTMAASTDWLDPERWKHDFVNDGRDECRRYLLYVDTIPNFSAVLFRRRVFEQAGGADESIGICGDWLTWVRMLMLSDIAFVARPLNRYRKHGGTLRSRALRGRDRFIGAYRILEFIDAKLALTPAEKEAFFERQTRTWLRKTLRLRRRTSLADALAVYRVARRLDPGIHARVGRLTRDRLLLGRRAPR